MSKVVKMKQLSFDRGKANLNFDMLQLNFTQKFRDIVFSCIFLDMSPKYAEYAQHELLIN